MRALKPKAHELLADVHSLAVRTDSAAFKEALIELSGGHRTVLIVSVNPLFSSDICHPPSQFPQIWLGGKFLGGADDVAVLNEAPLNVLHGMLQAAGVMGHA